MTTVLDVAAYRALKNHDAGASSWFQLDQQRINAFADATLDHQFIHIDSERTREQTPFEGTIAHGFLTLSMLPYLCLQVAVMPQGAAASLNYGFDKIRFIEPVRVGDFIRIRLTVADVTEKTPGQLLARYDVTVEIRDREKPALVAQWLGLTVLT